MQSSERHLRNKGCNQHAAPPSRVRCEPFLAEFSLLGTHSVSVLRQWRYFPSHSPVSFHLTDGRDRSSRGFFLDLPAGTSDATWNKYVRRFQGAYQIPDTIPSGLCFVMDSGHADYLIRLADKLDARNWEPGTFDNENSNLTSAFFPCCWGSGHAAVTRMLDECSRHANSGWFMSEESIHLAKVLKKSVQAIGIPNPSWWIDIPAEHRIPMSTACEHFRATWRTRPNDPLWATAFVDQIVMIAISVVYQALVRQRLLFLEPALR